jgi:hypothetical protein
VVDDVVVVLDVEVVEVVLVEDVVVEVDPDNDTSGSYIVPSKLKDKVCQESPTSSVSPVPKIVTPVNV